MAGARKGARPISGYLIAALLLIIVAKFVWAELLFAAWVILVSVHILRRGYPEAITPIG